jgi:hypothetical protein
MSRAGVLIAACLVGCLVVAGAPLAADQAEDAAQAAAESWLRVVDSGDYAGSWTQAARPLRGAVKQDDWAELVGNTRTPLRGLVSRKLKSRELTEKPPTTRVIGGRVYPWPTRSTWSSSTTARSRAGPRTWRR